MAEACATSLQMQLTVNKLQGVEGRENQLKMKNHSSKACLVYLNISLNIYKEGNKLQHKAQSNRKRNAWI